MALFTPGLELLDNIWTEIIEFVPKSKQDDMAAKLVKLFDDAEAEDLETSTYAKIRKAAKQLAGEDDEDEDGDD